MGDVERPMCIDGDDKMGGSALGDISMAEYTCWLEMRELMLHFNIDVVVPPATS